MISVSFGSALRFAPSYPASVRNPAFNGRLHPNVLRTDCDSSHPANIQSIAKPPQAWPLGGTFCGHQACRCTLVGLSHDNNIFILSQILFQQSYSKSAEQPYESQGRAKRRSTTAGPPCGDQQSSYLFAPHACQWSPEIISSPNDPGLAGDGTQQKSPATQPW
jgi:hypothetical protein